MFKKTLLYAFAAIGLCEVIRSTIIAIALVTTPDGAIAKAYIKYHGAQKKLAEDRLVEKRAEYLRDWNNTRNNFS